MKYLASRVSVASELISAYQYPEPFKLYLKKYFKEHKKFGSRDRREIAALCYSYFRWPIQIGLSLEQHLVLAASIHAEFLEEWNTLAKENDIPETDDLKSVQELSVENGKDYVETDMVEKMFLPAYSKNQMDFQPAVWTKNHASKKAGAQGLIGCEKLEERKEVKPPIQIQDLSSQLVCDLFEIEEDSKVWDVCSGAGGKSLNILSKHKINAYLSDKRSNVLSNAKKRIRDFGYRAGFAECDLSASKRSIQFGNENVQHSYFDTLIIDAPCTGSGTWFRNPEHFKYFNYSDINKYQNLQKKIVRNALPFLKTDGKMYYITCSVFKRENNDMKNYISNELGMKFHSEKRIIGKDFECDSMYMCAFTKSR